MAKAFSTATMSFKREPTDADLVALLGDADHPGRIVLNDCPESLRASPALIPLWFCVPWIFLLAAATTAMPWLAPLWGASFSGPDAQSMIAITWLAIVPALLAIIVGSNRYFRGKGDYFLVDKPRKTLTLCQLDRTVRAGEIASIVELSRWYYSAGWVWTRQVSVVVLDPTGQYEVLPVARESVGRLFGLALSNRLARVLGAPIRRISLTLSDSRVLSD